MRSNKQQVSACAHGILQVYSAHSHQCRTVGRCHRCTRPAEALRRTCCRIGGNCWYIGEIGTVISALIEESWLCPIQKHDLERKLRHTNSTLTQTVAELNVLKSGVEHEQQSVRGYQKRVSVRGVSRVIEYL